MATIYQKTVSDKQLILSPREFILRPFNFLAWTEMRLGIFVDGVTSAADNVQATSEVVTLSSSADRITFGIKNSSTNDLPGVAGSLFLGAVTPTGLTSNCNSGGHFESSGLFNQLAAAGYNGATLIGGTTSQYLTTQRGLSFPADSSVATGYNGFAAIRFVITNIGTSSQSVAISTASTQTIAGTDYSAQALRLLINGAAFDTPVSIAWNDGASAYTIPDAVFVRMPFYSNRIRISAIRAIRYAP